MKIKYLAILLLFVGSLNAQSISAESVQFQALKQPKEAIDANSRNFKVVVTSPYNLTADQVIEQSKKDHEQELMNYDNTVRKSEVEFREKTADYESEVVKAKEKFAQESAEFKKLSLIERLSRTDQGTNPKLVTPTKPVYYKPSEPVYRQPNLAEYTIVDNNVLASKVNINGYTRGSGYIDIALDIKNVAFQDNTGQTFANQPTKLVVKVNGVQKINETFFQDYAFISAYPSNNINKNLEEKKHLDKVINFVNEYLNNAYGYGAITKSVKIQSVKNKGKYDDLARADIYVTTNLKKLQPENAEVNAIALTNMQKGIDIWTKTLETIDYKNTKADFNSKIAEFVYMNLIRLNLALERKADAEKYLNQFQENQIYMKLNSSDQAELDGIEKQIYALKK